jgi:hypothetical protein
MTNKIAIIDFKNQDCGLKILFPNADYFILKEELDRSRMNKKFNINPIIHNQHLNVFNYINDDKYNTLFVVAGLFGSLPTFNGIKNDHYHKNVEEYLTQVKELVKKSCFKNVCFFDNDDYDYDPNMIFDDLFLQTHGLKFFKRYYSKDKTYKSNVYPFPYLIFGHQSNIEMIGDLFYTNKKMNVQKHTRIFFAGSPLVHVDNAYGWIRNRKQILIKIVEKIGIYNPGHIPHEQFMNEMKKSKYSLDLLGVGDPNIRTFEILCSGSLRLGEHSNLKWTFEDEFCEETIFNNEQDLIEKVMNLENIPGLYEKCLQKQNEIIEKYMNIECLKNYIASKI